MSVESYSSLISKCLSDIEKLILDATKAGKMCIHTTIILDAVPEVGKQVTSTLEELGYTLKYKNYDWEIHMISWGPVKRRKWWQF